MLSLFLSDIREVRADTADGKSEIPAQEVRITVMSLTTR